MTNDVMMKAYREGLPANGKFFPDGSKVVKIECTFKKNPLSPYFVQVPDTLKAFATRDVEPISPTIFATPDGARGV
jgi:hypothetical protein